PEVALLGLEAGQPLVEAAHEPHEPGRLPCCERRALAGSVEPACGVAPDRLEEPVAPRPVAILARHERLLDQVGEEERDLHGLETVAGTDLLGGLEREPARKDREAAEQRAFLGGEQVMAPVERRLERLLPG